MPHSFVWTNFIFTLYLVEIICVSVDKAHSENYLVDIAFCGFGKSCEKRIDIHLNLEIDFIFFDLAL